jgi:hypothetical protein
VSEELRIKMKGLHALLEKWIAEEGPQGLVKHYDEIFRYCLNIAEITLKHRIEYFKSMQRFAERWEARADALKNEVIEALALSLKTLFQELEGVIEEIKFERATALAVFITTYIPLLLRVYGLEQGLEQLKSMKLEIPEEIVRALVEWRREREEAKKKIEKYIT